MFKLICFTSVCLNWGALSSIQNTDEKPCKIHMVGGETISIDEYSCKEAMAEIEGNQIKEQMMQNIKASGQRQMLFNR